MIIGNHQLKGTVIKLKAPFAVLRKRKVSLSTDNNCQEGMSKAKKLKSHAGVELEVAGIVKNKWIFDKYPKVMVCN